MVAVGLWGAYLGAPAIWMLPVLFPMVMALGGRTGHPWHTAAGDRNRYRTFRRDARVGGRLCGPSRRYGLPGCWWEFLPFVTGTPHGVELPHAANAFTYAVGFVIATGLLHLAGIALGLLTWWPWGRVIVRTSGGVIACIGFGFLFGML